MQTVYVNVDCANIYRENNFRGAIDTQAVLWEKLIVDIRDTQFSHVTCEDGYQGWINNFQISEASPNSDFKLVTTNRASIFNEPDEKSLVIREAGAGCRIPVEEEQRDWCRVHLPDGLTGWMQKLTFHEIKGNPRENIIKLASRFLGVPYFWGGKTAKGVDCSGFIQLLFKLTEIQIRRDSGMQFDDAKTVSENFLDGRVGDLLFFAENGKTISHVALKLDDNQIIHARGMVKINSLNENDEHFDESLINTFIAVKTLLND